MTDWINNWKIMNLILATKPARYVTNAAETWNETFYGYQTTVNIMEIKWCRGEIGKCNKIGFLIRARPLFEKNMFNVQTCF